MNRANGDWTLLKFTEFAVFSTPALQHFLRRLQIVWESNREAHRSFSKKAEVVLGIREVA